MADADLIMAAAVRSTMRQLVCLLAAVLLVAGGSAAALQQAPGAAEAASLRPASAVAGRAAALPRPGRPPRPGPRRRPGGGSEGNLNRRPCLPACQPPIVPITTRMQRRHHRGAEIRSLPGYAGQQLPSRHFGGYITVGLHVISLRPCSPVPTCNVCSTSHCSAVCVTQGIVPCCAGG